MKLKFVALVFSASILLMSCKIGQYSIGMSEQQFKANNRMISDLVEASAEQNVYRWQYENEITKRPESKYFYFRDGKLIRVDMGVREPDVIIQNTAN